MTPTRPLSRGAFAIALPAVWFLAILGAAPCIAGSCAAPPLIPRSEMLTVEELRAGMKGVGKSVFRGTTVESFGVTVLGVLERVDFDRDLILVRIDSGPPVSQGYGVVSGMSGSPIYVNGKLIGALAYAWSFAKKPIAGVTPIAQMAESFRPGSAPMRSSGTLRPNEPLLIDGQTVERVVVAPHSAAASSYGPPGTGGLVPVATPVLVSGLDPASLIVLRNALEPMGLLPLAGAGSMGEIETRMVPGQAVGARLVGGDLDVTAVGTITYVKDDVLLAFGHPMSSLGSTDLPLVAAYVHGVMPSASLSFKLSSAGQSLGRFTEDRPGCLGGVLGERSRLVDAELRVADLDRGSARRYEVQVVRSRSLTSMLLNAVVSGAVSSLGAPSEGTARVQFSISAQGLPLLERENTYALENQGGLLALLLGSAGAAASATQELSEIVEVLQNSDFGESELQRLQVAVEVSERRSTARIERVRIPEHKVTAGDELQVIADVRTADGSLVTRTERVQIPHNCPPGRVRVGIAGGGSAEHLRSRLGIGYPMAETKAQMVDQMMGRPSNHDIVIQIALPTVGIEARGHALRDLPPAVIEVLRSAAATRLVPLRDCVEHRARTDWVVSGDALLVVTVDGKEKDKAGRPPSPRYQPPRYRRRDSGLLDIFSGLELATRGPSSVQEGGEGQEDIDPYAPPPMPTWEEVESVGEREISLPSAADEPGRGSVVRGEAVGRVASTWRLSTAKGFLQGETDGTVVLSEGGISLSPKPLVLARIPTQCLWPIAVGPEGSVYTGSWGDGSLRRTNSEGETAVVLETDDAAIQAVTVDADGAVYAAAIPSGRVYRIAVGEEPELLCDLDVQSIWALGVSKNGDIWAATGTDGALYRISRAGEAEIAFTAADRNITALAVGPDDSVYIGTSPLGKVYALAPDRGVRSVCELKRAAVQSIGVDAAGNVYVGTSPRARVLRIAPDGSEREMLALRSKHVLGISVQGDGTVYAAAGPDARIHVIHSDERTGEVYDPKASFVAAIASDGSGSMYLTAADTGNIVKLSPVACRTGRYISPVQDAEARARWGSVRWQGDCPEGTAASIWTRVGATAHPDETWSPWEPLDEGAGGRIQSPEDRFIQCRVDLRSEGAAAPHIESLELSYLTVNRPPEVRIASPKAGSIWRGTQTIRWSGRDPDGDKITYDVYWSCDGGSTWIEITSGDLTDAQVDEGDDGEVEQEVEEPEERERAAHSAIAGQPRSSARATQVGAHAQPASRLQAPGGDPGEDQGSEGASFYAEEGAFEDEDIGDDESDEEEPLDDEPTAKPSRATSRKWDTTGVSDGVYRLKVVGTDARSNPSDPRTDGASSALFTIDNTAPELIGDRRRAPEDPAPTHITVFDATTYVTSAEFQVDGGEWLAAMAADGIFDGQYEAIVLDGARLPAGSHEVQVRARDAAGNAAEMTLRYSQ